MEEEIGEFATKCKSLIKFHVEQRNRMVNIKAIYLKLKLRRSTRSWRIKKTLFSKSWV
jgi:hypothetical protein